MADSAKKGIFLLAHRGRHYRSTVRAGENKKPFFADFKVAVAFCSGEFFS